MKTKKFGASGTPGEEKWYFSVVDVIEVLTHSPRPGKYWNALKTKLQQEGSELSHNLGQLKMETWLPDENCSIATSFSLW